MTLSTSRSIEAGMLEPVPDPGLLLHLRQAEDAVRRRLQPSLDEAGISPEHWRVLSFLRAFPGQRMSEVAEAAVLPSASLTRHVDRLVELGLVVRRVDPQDRRSAVVALSPRGSRLADRLHAEEQALAAELGDDAAALTRVLGSVRDALG